MLTNWCAVHPYMGKPAMHGFVVCEPCRREGFNALVDIERIAMWLWTDPYALLPQRGSNSGRGSSSHKSAPPLNLGVAALFDPRSVAERVGDSADFELTVLRWAQRVCDLTGAVFPTPGRGQWPAVMVLKQHWDWVCKRAEWAGPCLWDINNTARNLREVSNENRGRAKLGRCPVRLDETRCGCLLLVRPDADHITCPRCATRWDRNQWRQLAEDIAYWDEVQGL